MISESRIKLLFNTLKHVKPIQLYYQVYYRVIKKLGIKPSFPKYQNSCELNINGFIQTSNSFVSSNRFTFLNIAHKFEDAIDWNYSGNGKLWTYNLNYFDFLNQSNLSVEEGLFLVNDFCKQSSTHKDGYEPYPISLRIINWVKFLCQNKIKDSSIDAQLYHDVYRLKSQLEYHILANHLFENGFGLLFVAYYFKDEKMYKIAKKIILSQLKEQILSDGAHYELTPMYHQIILFRILDCIQLVAKNSWKNDELGSELKSAAEKMVGWMNQICFDNGTLPMINDTTVGIAPTVSELNEYAKLLQIRPNSVPLKTSGYRKYKLQKLEALIDVGQIAPSYQPGHSHADNLQLLLQKGDKPVLVDTGISTYEKNERRQLERSTISHNTVTINEQNSSEVWSGFRVGRRARTTIHNELEDSIEASHNGFRKLNVEHKRSLQLKETAIEITDTCISSNSSVNAEGHLHFHPDRKVEVSMNQIFIDDELMFTFDQSALLTTTSYNYCSGYNHLRNATKIKYSFSNKTTFYIQN